MKTLTGMQIGGLRFLHRGCKVAAVATSFDAWLGRKGESLQYHDPQGGQVKTLHLVQNSKSCVHQRDATCRTDWRALRRCSQATIMTRACLKFIP